jgi:hypothetical protein
MVKENKMTQTTRFQVRFHFSNGEVAAQKQFRSSKAAETCAKRFAHTMTEKGQKVVVEEMSVGVVSTRTWMSK